jgi:Na+/melibiose symporter-like transporter
MNTLNGLFPYIGTLICYGLLMPLYYLSGESIHFALGVWGFGFLLAGIVWLFFVKTLEPDDQCVAVNYGTKEKHIFKNLWHRREIRLLSIVFICDFACYSYVAVVLPTYLEEVVRLTPAVVGPIAAIIFPGIGFVGCLAGGWLTMKPGKRKAILITAAALKLVGIAVGTLFVEAGHLWIYLGFCLFGFGNGFWMPAMYNMPMELEDMNPARVGASFSLMSSCAFFFGFFSPAFGGFLTDFIMKLANGAGATNGRAIGLRWSLFAFTLFNFVALLCSMMIKDARIHKDGVRKVFQLYP